MRAVVFLALFAGACTSPPEATPTPSATVSSSPTPSPTPRLGPPTADELAAVDVRLEEVARSDAPTVVIPVGDGLLVAQRAGRVSVLGSEEVVLDVSGEVSTAGEGGLLGLATDGEELFVSFTGNDRASHVIAYQLTDERPTPGTRRELLRVEQPGTLHNGGHLAVDDQGHLWFGLGDGGTQGDERFVAQELDQLLGKLLRIDPTPREEEPYAIPDDNPFVGRQDARPEIWALGLRNPWRFSIDEVRDELWIGDVGQFIWEEIDLLDLGADAGANLGWPYREGPWPFEGRSGPEGLKPPIHSYDHDDGGCAVVGGPVYRGRAIDGLQGAYLYGDLCDGKLRALSVREGEVVANRDLGLQVPELVSFAEGRDGEVYAVSLGGAVSRLVP